MFLCMSGSRPVACDRQRYQTMPQPLGGGLQLGQPLANGGILDGNLLARFMEAPRSRQAQLAAQAGAERGKLVQLLLDMERAVLLV